MFHKGPSLQTRMMDMKRGAMQAGRSLMGKLHVAYHTGRNIAHAVDRSYNMFSKICGVTHSQHHYDQNR